MRRTMLRKKVLLSGTKYFASRLETKNVCFIVTIATGVCGARLGSSPQGRSRRHTPMQLRLLSSMIREGRHCFRGVNPGSSRTIAINADSVKREARSSSSGSLLDAQEA
ncbi:hypothetical protein TNCV_1517791 [Trichonephila clavipes]|nr:hypothetical protein TNCV_1517791 [Trichonephila clavipes]